MAPRSAKAVHSNAPMAATCSDHGRIAVCSKLGSILSCLLGALTAMSGHEHTAAGPSCAHRRCSNTTLRVGREVGRYVGRYVGGTAGPSQSQ